VPILSFAIIAGAAYLLGSIPTGFLVARAKGIDIRSAGSGNIGATNAMRVLGRPAGIFVLVMDALKGFLAVTCLGPVLGKSLHVPPGDLPTALLIAGIAAVLGHNFTPWLGFKGGKGIATTAGVYLALAPLAVGIALVTWIVVTLVTRYVSVGSIVAALALGAAVWFTKPDLALRCVTIALVTMAIYKHKSNIKRLCAGTENRFGAKTKEPAKKS
jgi:glycerol-3-phosphate acyltransferase PlsY